jgi:hypothetical protein
MGATGSITGKAEILPCFSSFTAWEKENVDEMFYRGEYELAGSFALQIREFEHLIGLESGNQNIAEVLKERKYCREAFHLFETKKGVCDKYEVLCALTFLSDINSESKVALLFELFNFNKKGYLLPNEIKMLLVSATNAAKIVDKLLTIADSAMIEKLVKTALDKYALIAPQRSIRKPEFLLFAQETGRVQSFLDVWRGRVGHVVIPDDTLWADPNFDAADCSVTPSLEWLVHGLPPKGFTRWLRLSDVQATPTETGRTTLFSHILEISSRVKARGYLTGTGALARGYLKQGLLADRYLLNALAACVGRPGLIQGLFTATKQEAMGR